MRLSKLTIGLDIARRKIQFHNDEKWEEIELWSLFNWGEVSHRLKTGELTACGYTKENRVIWVIPSEEFYNKHIKPHRCEKENPIIKNDPECELCGSDLHIKENGLCKVCDEH